MISDGGSNQEECYYLGKACLLFRDKTERQEGINENIMLSNYDSEKINGFIENYQNYNRQTISEDTCPSRIVALDLKQRINV